ncbi:MarR family transcriptional regulator [Nocardia sp. 2]|uniref:MarR family transcriptional regulator n=1 Tax=Nocardia acididurans TaxID=2802282 RepID=A0ABS1MEN5_9NOCA|nr:MarR family transcriptional regulator [Nocardia acididurans]MBL1078204.1 MarR family transcriptional regulator [Nocardia acididurans]
MGDFRPSEPEGHGSGADEAIDCELLSLNAQLCFALYSTSRSMTAAYRPFLEDMRLTYPQYLVLLALWERPGITMKELGEQIHLDYGTVSPLVQRLQARGLVDSARSPADGRAVVLHATPASLELRHGAQHMIQTVLDVVGIPVDGIEALRDQVKALGARLDAVVAHQRGR